MEEKNDIVKETIMESKKTNKRKTEKDISKEDATRTTSVGGGLRFNEGKLRYDLVQPLAHRDMVEVLTDGANKYFDRNWERGLSWTSVLASLKRHIAAIERGEDRDPESGRLHIAHAACNVHFLNAFYYIFPQGDDRPKQFLKVPKIGIDIDGVIADFATAWSETYPEIEAKPTTWYFDRKIVDRFKKMGKDGVLEDFYVNKVQPLIDPKDLPFEPHCYITSRPVPSEVTAQWLDLYKFPTRPVYTVELGASKVKAAQDADVEIFVDDNFKNFVDLNNNGIFTYLFDKTYNRKHDVGHMRIKSLKEIPVLG